MDVMVDLETLSSAPDARIVSIGAVTFNAPRQDFYRVIDIERSRGSISPSTVKWWMQQSDAARIVFESSERVPLREALIDFQRFLLPMKDVAIWGNGATFDNVVLRQAYEAEGLSAPWSHRSDRCYRTLKNLYPEVSFTPQGTAHNALDDALAQARHAEAIFARIEDEQDDIDDDDLPEDVYHGLRDARAAILRYDTAEALRLLERLTSAHPDPVTQRKAYDAAMADKRLREARQ